MLTTFDESVNHKFSAPCRAWCGKRQVLLVNCDGSVNVTDLLAVINAWGNCPAPPALCAADATGDGMVNVSDLLMVINDWG